MTRRERLERRAQLRREWAEKAQARSAAAFQAAHDRLAPIPFGQPILVGHHSEKRHRRDIDRADRAMRRGCDEHKKAEHHASKTVGLEHQLETSIFSDDPDAIEALEAKAAAIDAECEQWKAVNVAHRKANGAPGWAVAAGLPAAWESAYEELKRICPYERAPIPAYQFSNARANARRLRKRIEHVKERQRRAGAAEAAGGVAIEGGARVRVTFAEKPDRSILDALKAAGFRWSGGSWHGERAKLPDTVQSP